MPAIHVKRERPARANLIPRAYDPRKEDLVHLKGDDEHGYANDMRLTKTALGHPEYRYRDRVVRCDVYRDPVTKRLSVHSMCPRCENYIWISEPEKQIEFDPSTGILSISPFECTWERGRGTEGTRQDRIAFGLGLCRLRIVVERNRARDA